MHPAPKNKWTCSTFKETKCISLEIKNNELLEKYNKIGTKFSNFIEKAFDTQLVFKEKYLKFKLKYCDGKNNIFFRQKSTQRKHQLCMHSHNSTSFGP